MSNSKDTRETESKIELIEIPESKEKLVDEDDVVDRDINSVDEGIDNIEFQTDGDATEEKTSFFYKLRSVDRLKKWRFFVPAIVIMYLEVILHLTIYGSVDKDIVYPLIFAAGTGMIISMLSILFPNKGNAIIMYLLLFVVSFYYVVQMIYYKIFGIYLSVVSTQGAGNAMDFKSVLFASLKENAGWIVLIFFPIVFLAILNIVFLTFKRTSMKTNIIAGAVTVFIWIAGILSLGIGGKETHSPYDLFHNRYVLELSMKKLGLEITTIKDFIEMKSDNSIDKEFQLSEGEAEPISADCIATGTDAVSDSDGATNSDAEEEEPVYVYQEDDDISFTSLFYGTDDPTLQNLSAYYSGQMPSYTNEYTGMFEGYNVVFISAESLSMYGISEECTPALYKIMNDGFVFENYYNPRWYHSTIDGEFVNCLGQYPSSADWSFYNSATTYQPYALGNALNELDYESYAYHDYDYYYYNRSETHANMGYDFKAISSGLELPTSEYFSDLETMQVTYEEFSEADPFNMYFMSFSGHLPYDYSNPICAKNREEVEELTADWGISIGAQAYIAAQMELDKALQYLMDELEEDGKLDNTVFIISPDHYPYGLPAEDYNSLAGFDVSSDPFEIHRACLGIWSASMEEPVYVDKLCASVDILPTVLNLLGVDFESRMLAGRDILSASDELVIFSDHSFMTDILQYNASTGAITYFVDESEVPDNYLQDTIEDVEDKIAMSITMINVDYYSYAYGKKEP